MSTRYLVTEPLGRGARVFRGVAESSDGLERDVAITRVLPNLTRNQKFIRMFLGDLGASRLLKHANVVETIDVAKTPEDAYFAVTEYVEGCDLETIVARRQRIAIPHAIHAMVECCKGLTCAHALGIVHRDLSPRNVLLSNNGEVKLAEFGLAKANTQRESSAPGIVNGMFSYLSPEAASGLPVDHRADVFAAGIILWELLGGRRLFLGETDYQTVELVRAARVPSIDGLDPTLDAIARKALARDASARYQHASELGDALVQHAFAHHIVVSPDDTATLVRDLHFEIRRERSREPVDPSLVACVQAEVRRMTSILEDDPRSWN